MMITYYTPNVRPYILTGSLVRRLTICTALNYLPFTKSLHRRLKINKNNFLTLNFHNVCIMTGKTFRRIVLSTNSL